MKKHNENLDRLEATGLFSKQFIENYNQIISRLDRKLRRNEFERGPWLVGHLPPFNFARDADPWCMCQDVPYDQPVPWEFVEIEALNGDSYRWKWGGLKAGTGPGWQEFRYEFRVARENSKWTVSYLQGFDISLILSDEISNRSTRAYWNRGKSLRFNCDNET